LPATGVPAEALVLDGEDGWPVTGDAFEYPPPEDVHELPPLYLGAGAGQLREDAPPPLPPVELLPAPDGSQLDLVALSP
jgi:hypothetical protein